MVMILGYGYGVSFVRKTGQAGPPPTPRPVLNLSAGNWLYPDDIANRPSWLTDADFTLGTNDFLWVTDHWEAQDAFPTVNGLATLTQGADSITARWRNAEVGTPYWINGYSVAGYVEGSL